MNWLEFKDLIEAKLSDQGLPHDVKIEYIELGYLHKDTLNITASKDGESVTISE